VAVAVETSLEVQAELVAAVMVVVAQLMTPLVRELQIEAAVAVAQDLQRLRELMAVLEL
jgi:hypothetical protein